MAASSTLIDTNILMELFFERAKQRAVVGAITSLPAGGRLAISILSLSTLLYYAEKEGVEKARAHAFLAGFKILDMNNDDYVWAVENDAGDFEDGLQVGCALRHHCANILTLDQDFARMYEKFIPVQTIK